MGWSCKWDPIAFSPGIGATVLAVTLLVCGFAACCLPVTTASLAGAVSTGRIQPYTHEQLVELAQETARSPWTPTRAWKRLAVAGRRRGGGGAEARPRGP
ncbi:MAG: hypothetical protein ACLUE1_01645 [Adlercreutzia equolifaciens]